MMVSRPALLYVFADRVLPRPGLRQRLGGQALVRPPFSDHPVLADTLDQWLLAWAFWELADAGAVALEMVRPDRGIEGGVGLVTGFGPETEHRAIGPLAAALLPHVPTKRSDIFEVILAWAGDRRPLPADGVTAVVTGELAAIGWAPAGLEAEWERVLAA